MMALLTTLAILTAPCERAQQQIVMHVEVTPTEARLGDVLFVRIRIQNSGDAPVAAPQTCVLEAGTLSLQLYDPREHTNYIFVPEGGPSGDDVTTIPLMPGEVRTVSLLVVQLPRLDDIHFRFWNPATWRRGEYNLSANCGGIRGWSANTLIDRRDEKEMQTLLECYGAGAASPVPRDWDIDQPSLGVFGLLSFPLACSRAEKLAAMEETLSPGSLRDLIHVTRLTQAVYSVQAVEERRKATAVLIKWLDSQPEVQREWVARQLVLWAWRNMGLRDYSFEFLDQVIPRLPRSYGGQEFREKCRKENDYLRQSYLEHLRKSQSKDGK